MRLESGLSSSMNTINDVNVYAWTVNSFNFKGLTTLNPCIISRNDEVQIEVEEFQASKEGASSS